MAPFSELLPFLGELQMVPRLCLVLGALFSSSCKRQVDILTSISLGMAHAVYKSEEKNVLEYGGRIGGAAGLWRLRPGSL